VVTSLATIMLVIATAILAKATNRLNDISGESRCSDRVKLTRDLYNQFFSLAEYRSKAWFWVENLESEKPRKSFEQLWRVTDQTKFMELYRVLAFWFLFYRLYQAGELDKKLAGSLFASNPLIQTATNSVPKSSALALDPHPIFSAKWR